MTYRTTPWSQGIQRVSSAGWVEMVNDWLLRATACWISPQVSTSASRTGIWSGTSNELGSGSPDKTGRSARNPGIPYDLTVLSQNVPLSPRALSFDGAVCPPVQTTTSSSGNPEARGPTGSQA